MERRLDPFLWFTAPLGEVVNYYRSVFGPEVHDGEVGGGFVTSIEVFGTKLLLMSAPGGEAFTSAFSLSLACRDQAEIDLIWSRLSAEGKPLQCGWCADKYGVRWQVLPHNLGELLAVPGAMERMMQMTKIDIAGLKG